MPAQMHERREKEREQLDMAEALNRKIQAQSDAEMRWARAHGFDFPGGEVGDERQMDVGANETTRREKEMWAQELMWMPVSQAAEMERQRQQLREMQLKRHLWERERDARMQETFEWVKEKERENERDKERERQQERMEGDFDDNSVVCVTNVCDSQLIMQLCVTCASLMCYCGMSILFLSFSPSVLIPRACRSIR